MKLLSRFAVQATVIMAVVATLGLTSCDEAEQPKQPKQSEQTIHLRLLSFALVLHPLKMADVESRRVATLLYAGLVAQDQEGTAHPVLAKEWSRSGNEWEFDLRPGATFSNGAPVTAADVVSSLCAAMQPTSPWSWSLASIVHEVKSEGEVECTGLVASASDRVHIRENRASPWLLDALSGPAGWILPASTVEEGAYGVMPGAGPYKIREIIPDVKVVLEARPEGSPIEPGVDVVQFDYLPDDAVAIGRFTTGKLHVLNLASPQLVELMTKEGSGLQLKYPGRLSRSSWDRIRVAIINEKALAAKGFYPGQVRAFIDAFSAATDRKRIAELSKGTAEPAAVAFLPVPAGLPIVGQPAKDVSDFPKTQLTIITEPDPYSDLIASALPKQIGDVSVDYKGVEKGILISSLVKGQYDVASLLIEAPIHSPAFWKSFFTPGSPLVAFGKPIDGLDTIDVIAESGIQETASRILAKGNWIAIVRERRLQALAPGITGVMLTPSGQENYAFIGMK